MKKKTLLLMAFFYLTACGQGELELPLLEKGEFILEVDYSKSITELIDECEFGYIDQRIFGNYSDGNKQWGKKS